jgi:hypothetical protein
MNIDEKVKIQQIIALCNDLLQVQSVSPQNTITPPVITITPGIYTSTDTIPRPFPVGSLWLIDSQSIITSLQGRCWWLLEEMAKAANIKIIVLRGCPLSGELEGSPAHRPCDEIGGGMMVDCRYPILSNVLDIVKMKAMVDKFLSICCPIIPGKEYLDISNESEIRIGSDVFTLIGGKYILNGQVNRHIQIDDGYHHRFDDTIYPHFHLKWSIV